MLLHLAYFTPPLTKTIRHIMYMEPRYLLTPLPDLDHERFVLTCETSPQHGVVGVENHLCTRALYDDISAVF